MAYKVSSHHSHSEPPLPEADNEQLVNFVTILLENAVHGQTKLTPLIKCYLAKFHELYATMPIETWYADAGVELLKKRMKQELDLDFGQKHSASLQKLMEMQLEWFGLRFGEYVDCAGYPSSLHDSGIELERLGLRNDALESPPAVADTVSSVSSSPRTVVAAVSSPSWPPLPALPTVSSPALLPPAAAATAPSPPAPAATASRPTSLLPAVAVTAPSQPSKQPSMTEETQRRFILMSWEQILEALEREETATKRLPAAFHHRLTAGPMTAFITSLAYHTLDNLHKVNSVISDYVTRHRDEHIENEMTIEELVNRGQFFDLAGRLAADMAMLDHLPLVVKGWRPFLVSRVGAVISHHFSVFQWNSSTGALYTYTLKGDERMKEPEYWPLQQIHRGLVCGSALVGSLEHRGFEESISGSETDDEGSSVVSVETIRQGTWDRKTATQRLSETDGGPGPADHGKVDSQETVLDSPTGDGNQNPGRVVAAEQAGEKQCDAEKIVIIFDSL